MSDVNMGNISVEPYKTLFKEGFSGEDIEKIEELCGGRQIFFRRWIKATEIKNLYPELAEAIGIKKTFKLAKLYSGGYLYFPKSASKKKMIKKEFNGGNYAELARKYDYSERQIRRIISCVESQRSGKRTEMEGQISLW